MQRLCFYGLKIIYLPSSLTVIYLLLIFYFTFSFCALAGKPGSVVFVIFFFFFVHFVVFHIFFYKNYFFSEPCRKKGKMYM